ncbi:Nif3-like dinuclear metal center hexameric protein [Ruicaihuangia caeni]|uniref:Nif3-like dinuclear metal center hexameric protein n=1 Tax=Ruicaihuangia caeni TaxID=3042517 RepID=UPI00338DDEB5
MPYTAAEVNAVIHRLWPLETAEAWDAPGFLAGSPDERVEHVHLAVDAVSATVDEALELGADLLLVHHPLLLRGVTSVSEDRYKGALLARLIRGGCALTAAHTNADIVERGTSAMLAEALGLVDTRPIVPSAGSQDTGLGRVGTLPAPIALRELAQRVASTIPATRAGIRVAGDATQPVRTVALCGGAGDSLLSHPAVTAADVYITADLRHHPASEAREQAMIGGGPALIDLSHWASEWLWLPAAAEQLRAELPRLTVTISELSTDPWDFVVGSTEH